MELPAVLRSVFGKSPTVVRCARNAAALARRPAARPRPKGEPVAERLLVVSASRLASEPTAVCEEVCGKLSAIGCLEHFHLPRTQRTAWLVVTYDAIVRASGHKRYFRMYGVDRANEVLEALVEIGAEAAVPFLREAIHREFAYLDDNETAVGGVGFPSARLGPPPQYSDVDSFYRELAPQIRILLEQYMLAHRSAFLSIEGAYQGVAADEACAGS
jgi:hypothetical protein